MVQLYGYTCEFLAHCTRTVGTVWVRGHGDVLVMVIAGDGHWYGVQCVVPKCVSLHCWAVWARGDFRDGGKRRRRRGYSPAGTRFHRFPWISGVRGQPSCAALCKQGAVLKETVTRSQLDAISSISWIDIVRATPSEARPF